MRGNPVGAGGLRYDAGSIPACAGEPRPLSSAGCPMWVYPRVCGGTGVLLAGAGAAIGLSPRVRGNRGGTTIRLPYKGSIPACAGEPARRRACTTTTRVYPRVCGGTVEAVAAARLLLGLSPRVRGNPRRAAGGAGASGSIPACAGEPCPPAFLTDVAAVYPRVCGGTARTPRPSTRGEGLSPRVRGNLLGRQVGERRGRSIPACAGEPMLPR